MTNEKEFFDALLKMDKVKPTEPLTNAEIEQIYFDVSRLSSISPLIDFVRRIENAHGIGVYDE